MKNQISSPDTSHRIILYTAAKGKVKAHVFFAKETFWMTQQTMNELFGVNAPASSKHLKNIYAISELQETISKMKTVQNNDAWSNRSKIVFAVIYQGYVKAGKELEYRKAWNMVAQYFIEQRGAIGSCLHQTADGMWLAYSRWPDKKTRDASWPGDNAPSSELPSEIRLAVLTIKNCLDQDRKLPDICMQVVDDLLVK